jgi:hypothetical protein
MLSLRKGGGIVFKKLFSLFAVLALFVAAAPVEAASIEFDLSGYVTSDVFTSPVVFTPGSYFYPATLPTDATGQRFSGSAIFTDGNVSAISGQTFDGLLSNSQSIALSVQIAQNNRFHSSRRTADLPLRPTILAHRFINLPLRLTEPNNTGYFSPEQMDLSILEVLAALDGAELLT